MKCCILASDRAHQARCSRGVPWLCTPGDRVAYMFPLFWVASTPYCVIVSSGRRPHDRQVAQEPGWAAAGGTLQFMLDDCVTGDEKLA